MSKREYRRFTAEQKLEILREAGKAMATELQAALGAVSGAQPRVVHDHGSEFVNRDVAAVIKTHNLIAIKTNGQTEIIADHRS